MLKVSVLRSKIAERYGTPGACIRETLLHNRQWVCVTPYDTKHVVRTAEYLSLVGGLPCKELYRGQQVLCRLTNASE